MRINGSRMAQSLLSGFFLLLYMTVDSYAYCRPLRQRKSKGALAFQGALLSVLHLCPVLPMGGGGLGLTERVQHINFNCIAESLFPTQPPPYLSRSPAPTPSIPGGWARRLATQPHPVPLGMLGRKYSAASGTAGAITPYH